MPETSIPLSPEELAYLIKKLDAVMEEAANLRSQVTRQLVQHYEQRQPLPPTRKRPR
jgi:hypothetical protein